MSKSVAARSFGDDYQGRFFWLQVCRLFEERTKVVRVEMENKNVKSLDDVVVYYKGMFDNGKPITADYYQVKFHLTTAGAFTWQGMMDPKFINASSVSLLSRIHNAQKNLATKGQGFRFNIFSPWTAHPDDEMAKLLDLTDGHVRWDILSKGSARSKMGKIRNAWCQHLQLAADEDLRCVLAPIRIKQGPTFEELGRQMNCELKYVGFKPMQEGALVNPYDELARKFIQQGRTSFTRVEIEGVCRREGLWVGRTIPEPNAIRIGVRSFWKFAEVLEDETDTTLCLLRYFDGRVPKNISVWNKAIIPEITQFVRKNIVPSQHYHIRLQTHGTIAFFMGWELNPKSGVDIVPVQDSITGRHIWRSLKIDAKKRNKYPSWKIESTQLQLAKCGETVLAISVSHDIERDVLNYTKRSIRTASLLIHCRLPVLGPAAILNGTHAQLLAEDLVHGILKYRPHYSILHVFFSAPNGFMFFLGRLAHVLAHSWKKL